MRPRGAWVSAIAGAAAFLAVYTLVLLAGRALNVPSSFEDATGETQHTSTSAAAFFIAVLVAVRAFLWVHTGNAKCGWPARGRRAWWALLLGGVVYHAIDGGMWLLRGKPSFTNFSVGLIRIGVIVVLVMLGNAWFWSTPPDADEAKFRIHD